MVTVMFAVVSYDIVSDKRRRRVSKLLEGYGERQQYSVFECDVSEKRLAELKRKLGLLIDPQEDSVRIYRMCAMCRGNIEVIGQGDVLKEVLVVVI